MDTWVLVIVLATASNLEPRGITSISGFRSKVDCVIAGGALSDEKIFKDGSPMTVMARCIPGPTTK